MMAVTYDTENNDTYPNADIIPINDFEELYVGVIDTDNSDWVTFMLNSSDRCEYSFTVASSPFLRADIYSDNPPTNIVHTLIPGETYTHIAVFTGFHFVHVYTSPDDFPSPYSVHLVNLDNPTLPVTLSSFTALYSNNGVGISWTTQSENNLNGYNLIRSENSDLEDGININGTLILASNTSTLKTYTFRDEELDDVGEYYYWLEVVEIDGGIDYHGPVQVEITEDNPQGETPDVNLNTRIVSSYPNPFSNSTDVTIEMEKSLPVELSVYNIRGEKVNVILSGQLDAGNHVFNWNGKDIHGRNVANGVYFFRLNTNEGSYIHKLTYIK
jgi:hypothetical protein